MNNPHPDPAEIAALDEDLLSEPEAAALRDHLADCASCAEVHAELLALREELRALPAPSIPDDVAARIDAALAAEATADSPAADSRGVPPRESSPSVSRETEEHETAEWETAESEHATLVPVPVARPRWPRMALAAAGVTVAVGLGALLTQSLIGQSELHDTNAGSAEDASEETTALASEPLEDQVRELLAEAEGSPGTLSTMEGTEGDLAAPSPESSSGTGQSSESGALDEQSGTTAPEAEPLTEVPSCVEDAIGRQEAPLAAEAEDYEGVDAYLVLFRHTADPERVDAYVVDADCVSATPPASGEILVQQSYPVE
ncbi:hypothetical protein E1265_31845 [Streptomyces sp. 8K308]|uniref:anti-sigma factor family protein n=1 Tax=Streptomyces sp. 8K308 TaxID=2530388 RepID=UPI001048DAD3|nr:hypothetical protein [Streptomyces sp. 8K308]TDC09890.1 hypothetical protein E1265_31845 [Streptomyces sp. 8K308]